MGYDDHFRIADDYIRHTDTIVDSISDPFIQHRYIGFITISAVTAYELAIKDIFIGFANKKNKVFGAYIANIYDRINGRISLNDLKSNHMPKYGNTYLKRFERIIAESEKKSLKQTGRSIKSSYGNIIKWRHSFVHDGLVAPNASYYEVKRAYEDGKEVIHILAKSMVR